MYNLVHSVGMYKRFRRADNMQFRVEKVQTPSGREATPRPRVAIGARHRRPGRRTQAAGGSDGASPWGGGAGRGRWMCERGHMSTGVEGKPCPERIKIIDY